MFELEIGGKVYQFKFGMGFLRKINKQIKQQVDGLKNVEENIGAGLKFALVKAGDVEALAEVLLVANDGYSPRVTAAEIDNYIDSELEDLEGLFEKVLDFLRKANATKKTMKRLDEEEAKRKEEQQKKQEK